MRTLFFILLTAFTVNTWAADVKIAVVDVQKALLLSNTAKASFKKFEKDNKKEVKKLKDLREKLLKLKEKLQKNSDVMSESERSKLTSSYEEKATEFKFYSQKLQQQEKKMQQEVFQKLLPKAEGLLKKIIDEGKYDLVLQASSGIVVFATPKVNLTKKLLDSLNKG